MPDLDRDQIAAFGRDGYRVLPGVFDGDEVAAMRNGPNRLNELPWEWRYQRMKASGEFVESFRAAS